MWVNILQACHVLFNGFKLFLKQFIKQEGLPFFIVLLALLLRLTNLEATTLWIDEIYSLMVANTHLPPERLTPLVQTAGQTYQQYLSWQPLKWNQLLAMLKINVHMPLYYCFLNPWLSWFGNHATGLRSFSAVCSALALVPVYGLVKTVWGRTTALWALLLMAVSPFQIYFAQEGRMYTLSLLWCCWSSYFCWKTLFEERSPKKGFCYGLLYAASVLAACLTHYMAVFIVGFHVVFMGWVFLTRFYQNVSGRFRVFETLIRFLPALVLLLLAVYLWFPVYQAQQHGVDSTYHFAKGAASWVRYGTLPLWYSLVFMAGDNDWQRIVYFPVTGVLLLIALARSVYAIQKHRTERTELLAAKDDQYRMGAVMLLTWFLLPVLLQIGYDVLKDTHTAIIDRYVMLCSPPVYMAMAIALESLSRKMGSGWHHTGGVPVFFKRVFVGCTVLLAVLAVWSPSPFRDIHNKSNPVRDHLGAMAKHNPLPDLVVVNGPWGANLTAAYYLWQFFPRQRLLYWMSPYQGHVVKLPEADFFKNADHVWLFRYRANNERGLQAIKNHLQNLYPAAPVKIEDGFWYASPLRSAIPD